MDSSEPPLERTGRQRPTMGRRIEGHFQGKILPGLMQLMPILVTVFVLAFIIGHTDGFIRPMPFIGDRPWDFPGIGLIGIIAVFYIMGLFVSVAMGRKALGGMGFILSKVPVVRTIFNVTEQATNLLASDHNFSRVVFLEWPREGMVAIGFVTGRAFSQSGGHWLAREFTGWPCARDTAGCHQIRPGPCSAPSSLRS